MSILSRCHLAHVLKKHVIFSHPDFTVGSGVAPDRPFARFTDFSACAKSPSVGNTQSLVAPCPEEFLIYFTITIVCKLGICVNYVFTYYPFNFIVNWILCFFKSTLITLTSTMSPTLTTSSGCLMYLSQICEM